jgi:hypothetical protein
MYDAPGHRITVTFPGRGVENKDPIATNSFAYIDSKVLLLTKTTQLGNMTRPTDTEATNIMPGERCVGSLGGVHELALAGGLSGIEQGDKLWINTVTHEIVTDPTAVGTNEKQSVKVNGTGGTYRLELDGELTAKLAPGLTAAQLREALEKLSNIDPGDIAVTGGPGDSGGTVPYVVTFTGQYEDANVPTLAVVEEELTGGGGEVTVTTTTAGAAGAEVVAVGVVDEVDPTRTPHVARINANALHAFITA